MGTTGEPGDHRLGLVRPVGLAQDAPALDHRRVGNEDRRRGPRLLLRGESGTVDVRDSRELGEHHALQIGGRRLSGQRRFVGRRHVNDERNPQVREDLSPSR